MSAPSALPTRTPTTTIVVVPRETFANQPAGVADIIRHRERDARVLVIDAGSPRRVREELERLARQHDLALVRVDRYMTPSQTRNLAMQHVTTPLAVFVDGDVRVASGWLDALEDCAVETGAAVVAPLTIMTELGRTEVHQVGGEAHVDEFAGVRSLRNSQAGRGRAQEENATRTLTEEAEFHCMLVDCAWFRQVGGLDEGLLSLYDHTDYCMRVRDAGGTVWAEPHAVVTYGRPRFIDRHDREFYVLRWSERWNVPSGERFRSVWRLDVDPYQGIANWTNERRRYGYRPITTPLNRLGRFGRSAVDLIDRIAQRRVVTKWERTADRGCVARFAHVASWQQS